ncbi:ATP-binding protein [Paenibacillus contaminans]|uniref:histidine kinase n=1 Tax=Paenibacillus contaminans TaxID=450362 RepID=A0A329MSC2_9BACL|nr:ATP-binding protein [Paenibacillus contaminans]RAV22871.1 histidine kinase [Paenibacillus contaminans]
MMTNRKMILYSLIFLILLTGLRLILLNMSMPPNHPAPNQGVLDLRHWDFNNNRTIPLDGTWEFYPNQFIEPQEGGTTERPAGQTYIQVPGEWNAYMPSEGGSSFGYGSYRLRILIGDHAGESFGLLVKRIHASSTVIFNGQTVAEWGRPAERKDIYTPKLNSYSVSYIADERQEIEIIVHAANFDNNSYGGITKSLKFGSQAATDSERMYAVGFQFTTFIVLILHAVYAGILYIFNRRQKTLGYFIMLLLSASFNIISDDDILLMMWVPIGYVWGIKIVALSYISSSYFMLKLALSLFPEYKHNGTFRWFFALCSLFAGVILLFPVQTIFDLRTVHTFIFLFSPVAVMFIIIRMALKRHTDAIYLIFSGISILSGILWGFFETQGWVSSIYYPFDIIAAILGFAAYWFKRYFRNAEQTAELAKQLQKTDKLKDDFLANTSHELRTPLHGMINIAQSVVSRGGSKLGSQNGKDLELLITIGRRMSYLLNDLLDLTQLKENRISLNPAALRVQSVASGVLDMLDFMTEGKPIRLVMEIPDHFPPVVADEKRLVQILFNLLHNAIKYTNEGTIVIDAEVKNGMAYVHVSDTGIGMDPVTLSKAFQPYEQGENGKTAGNGGIGLGLSICKQLVELHGGFLAAESSLGSGSVFTFTLPLSEANADSDEVSRKEPEFKHLAGQHDSNDVAEKELRAEARAVQHASASSRPKILAVDDDPVNLKVLSNILSTERYDIVTAMSGKEALTKLDKEQWDLVIADVMMPQMSGYEFARIIRERFSISELPVLLLTARSQPADVYSGFLSGANDYVTKPVDAMELQYRVDALTALKQSVGERLRMEAAYLQAQIQPHFLFNTLNSIMALADIDQAKMRDLTESFSSYLRISFDFWNSEKMVPLEHELELVRSYLYIQKERFEERLDITWEVGPGVRIKLPPLTIQPLVENAVSHGVLRKAEGGTVRVQIAKGSGNVKIVISDDGVGMEEERLRQLLDGSAVLIGRRGIGLLNTDRRLKQLYGKGLEIRSKPGEGTTVSFEIPV